MLLPEQPFQLVFSRKVGPGALSGAGSSPRGKEGGWGGGSGWRLWAAAGCPGPLLRVSPPVFPGSGAALTPRAGSPARPERTPPPCDQGSLSNGAKLLSQRSRSKRRNPHPPEGHPPSGVTTSPIETPPSFASRPRPQSPHLRSPAPAPNKPRPLPLRPAPGPSPSLQVPSSGAQAPPLSQLPPVDWVAFPPVRERLFVYWLSLMDLKHGPPPVGSGGG